MGSKGKKQYKWTNKEIDYLKSIEKGKTHSEIKILMVDKFKYDFSIGQLKGIIERSGIRVGTGSSFKKGHTPWNKGTKGVMKANKGSFKKGVMPTQFVHVGSERVNRDGYVEIKTKNPSTWELKHRYIYKKHYGEIPEDCNIIFADTNKTNFNIDNLILVSRAEMLIMNHNKLIYEDKELTKVGANIAKVLAKVSDIKK